MTTGKVSIIGFSLILLVGMISCSRKSHPSRTKPKTAAATTPVVVPPAGVSPVPVIPPTAAADSVANVPPVSLNTPMIVIDGSGEVITPKDKLPADIAAKVNYSVISKAFTPEQKKNLIYRFKIIPPKILYVPEQYISKSAKGKYIVYRKKFWYWQKSDGLFYLDETYYH